MRYGVLSDVHANLAALQAAVRRLSHEGVDGWLCAGDLVGYGPQPNECIETVAGLGAVAVAGNHELTLLGRMAEEQAGELARRTLRWTRDVLAADARAYLADLPTVAEVDGLVVAHGALGSPGTYVKSAAQAAAQLGRLERDFPAAGLLVLGHTHRPMLVGQRVGWVPPAARSAAALTQDRFLVNPGSVGQSRQWERAPRTRFVLLDREQGRARFFAEDYAVDATMALLRGLGLPRSCIHLPRTGRHAVRGRLAGTLRRSAGGARWQGQDPR